MKLRFLIELSHLLNYRVVTREEWQARPPKEKLPLRVPVPYVIIHHSYNPSACHDRMECSQAMKQMQDRDIDELGLSDIEYHFCIGGDGAAYEGRGWNVLGSQPHHFNTISIGICLIGDWRTELPPEKQLQTAKMLIVSGVQLGYIHPDYKLIGHRQVRNVDCPGDALYNDLQSWDNYSCFPASYKDLLNVIDLPDSEKQNIIANSNVTKAPAFE